MNIHKIISKATTVVKYSGGFLKENGPTIATVTGSIGVVATAVLASKETLKFQEMKKVHEESLLEIEDIVKTNRYPEYSDKDALSDRVQIYTRIGKDFVKCYWPSLLAGGVSIGLILFSHKAMMKRVSTLMAAYKALETAFQEFRKNSSKILENVPKETLKKAVNKTDIPEEDKRQVLDDLSPYSRVWNKMYAPSTYEQSNSTNLAWLHVVQNSLNDRLESRGYLFLNEVYDALGLDWTPEGQVVGWSLRDSKGDGVVNIHAKLLSEKLGDENGRDTYGVSYILDFNVDGPILDRM